MPMIIPAAIESVIKEADTASTPIDEVSFAGAITKAAPDFKTACAEERHGAFAEIAAWRFSRSSSASEAEPWGLYWGPISSGTMADGTPFYRPDIAEMDEAI